MTRREGHISHITQRKRCKRPCLLNQHSPVSKGDAEKKLGTRLEVRKTKDPSASERKNNNSSKNVHQRSGAKPQNRAAFF